MIAAITHNLPAIVVNIIRLSLWLAILVAIFVPLERLFAVHPARIFRAGIGADLGYYFLSGTIASVLLSFPLGWLAWTTRHLVPDALRTALDGAPFWTRALIGLLAGETGYYWAHRLMHTVPFLWRFHAIHHSPSHIDFLVNSRTHPVDLVFGRFCTYVPLYVLGLAQPSSAGGSVIPVLLTVGTMIWSYFIHANIKWRFGPLEWVLSTPGFHHWHHALEPANRNYASILPALDVIFRTSHLPRGQWPGHYGIPGEVPASWTEQLVMPLLGPFPLARGPRPDARRAV